MSEINRLINESINRAVKKLALKTVEEIGRRTYGGNIRQDFDRRYAGRKYAERPPEVFNCRCTFVPVEEQGEYVDDRAALDRCDRCLGTGRAIYSGPCLPCAGIGGA